MEMRTLRYFLAVAEQESFSKAANDVLFVTQPTLSRQMQELEEEMGVKLFVRSNKKTTLTEEGVQFQKRAQEIMELVGNTKSEFSNLNHKEVEGDVFIGAAETVIFSRIAKTCRVARKKHPKIRFHITSGNAEDVKEKLERGLLDFALLIEPIDKSKYDYLEMPEKDSWGLLVKRNSPLARKKKSPQKIFKKFHLSYHGKPPILENFQDSLERILLD